ncbi:MAG: type II toxin-antitoxin system ParD family antitoxin [Nitrospiria bacterium]
MNVSLTPKLEELVNQKVQSGLYNSASEVIRSALRLLEEKDRMRAVKLAALRDAIQEGIDSGAPTPLDMGDVIRRGKERLGKNKKASK